MSQIIKRKPICTFKSKSLPPAFIRVLSNRGIQKSVDIRGKIADILPISSLEHTDIAAQLLHESITQQRSICIVADFDADGATACAIVVRYLRQIGGNVSYQVPDRIRHGYGLSAMLVEEIIHQHSIKPELIVTVDNGISSHEGVAIAKDHGIQVLITDHHLPTDTLPNADVIVNPNCKDSQFKSKHLCGAGVAFYVIAALHNRLKISNFFTGKVVPKLSDLLDILAIGTVADMVSFDKNNRILVAAGLQKIRQGFANAGVKALFEVAKKRTEFATTSDISFGIAPRINAAGRMDDMRIGIDCLLTDDYQQAMAMAQSLDDINQLRREIEGDIQEECQQILSQIHLVDMPFGLCLYQSDWHEGVVGIVAGRLKEKHHRPVVVFARSSDGYLKGSARSVAGCHIRDMLDNIDKDYGVIIKFGGHAMAAGLTILEKNFVAFSKAFDMEVKSQLTVDDLRQDTLSDGALQAVDFNLDFAKSLMHLVPWGKDFPEPVFDNKFFIITYRVVGERHLKMVLRLINTQTEVDAIAFNTPPDILPLARDSVRMAYRLDVNFWQERESLQLMIIAIEP